MDVGGRRFGDFQGGEVASLDGLVGVFRGEEQLLQRCFVVVVVVQSDPAVREHFPRGDSVPSLQGARPTSRHRNRGRVPRALRETKQDFRGELKSHLTYFLVAMEPTLRAEGY